MIAVIGPTWLEAVDESGQRRLADERDWVRVEIATALEKNILVIPVLVSGTSMPSEDELPDPLKPLSQLNAHEIDEHRWDYDVGLLQTALEDETGIRPIGRIRRLLSARPRVLIGVGVVLVALAALLAVGIAKLVDTSSLLPFNDNFSTEDYNWKGGVYGEGVYEVSLQRGVEGSAVAAFPQDAFSDENLRISVDAHRTGGTATERYAYGIFCRGDGQNNFYAFSIWTNQATLAKRTPGSIDPIALAEPNRDVRATVEGDPPKKLEATCTSRTVNGQPAVDLRFWVNDQLILEGTDPITCQTSCGPTIESGSFGLRASLGKAGADDDTLEVTFDDFAAREE